MQDESTIKRVTIVGLANIEHSKGSLRMRKFLYSNKVAVNTVDRARLLWIFCQPCHRRTGKWQAHDDEKATAAAKMYPDRFELIWISNMLFEISLVGSLPQAIKLRP